MQWRESSLNFLLVRIALPLLLATGGVVAYVTAPEAAQASAGGAWLDSPSQHAYLDPGVVEVLAHSSSDPAIGDARLEVNGAVVQAAGIHVVSGKLTFSTFQWQADVGQFSLVLVAGSWRSQPVTVTVGQQPEAAPTTRPATSASSTTTVATVALETTSTTGTTTTTTSTTGTTTTQPTTTQPATTQPATTTAATTPPTPPPTVPSTLPPASAGVPSFSVASLDTLVSDCTGWKGTTVQITATISPGSSASITLNGPVVRTFTVYQYGSNSVTATMSEGVFTLAQGSYTATVTVYGPNGTTATATGGSFVLGCGKN